MMRNVHECTTMYKKCLIITGGEFCELDIINNSVVNSAIIEENRGQWIQNTDDISYIIACDHGLDYAMTLGITPNLLVGDYDSVLNMDEGMLASKGIEVLRFPAEKDDTDTMLAIKKAMELGYKDVIVACAFGGRLDHAYANLQAGAYAAREGVSVTLVGADTIAYVVNSSIRIHKRDGWSLSVFSVSDKCTNVSISGCKYNTDKVTLTNTFPIGISNEFLEDEAIITLSEGILLVMMCKLK